jgi:hypothetical protein
MKTLIRSLSLSLAICLVIGLTGCPFSPDKDDTKDPVVDPFKANTSPENLLLNLRQAYIDSDIEEFSDLLDVNYEFKFSEEDQGQPGTPLGLTKDEEIAIHTNMFSDMVDKLELEFEFDPMSLLFDDVATTVLTDSIFTLDVTSVQLTLKGRLPGQPDMTPVTWQLDNGSQIFWFHKMDPDGTMGDDAIDSESGDPLWTIIGWEETTISGGK